MGRSIRRILVVEDEIMVAMHLEDMLTEFGYEVVGPAPRLDPALALARDGGFDFAILDVNLAGRQSFPVADVLVERGIPFIFATGYGTLGLTERYGSTLTLQKPVSGKDLQRAILRALAP
jgi:CheY-like chemotaxis protein